jgi:AcrR family transcriptional regulator
MNPHSESAVSAPRLRGRLREATRNAILEAAEEVYSRHGLGTGRIEQVAGGAGVSVGTVYNYFENRDALVAAVLAARRAELLARMERAIAAAPERFAPRLHALLSTVFTHFAEHKQFLSLFAQEAPGCTGSGPGVGTGSAETIEQIRECARQVIELGRAERKLRPENPRFLAAVLIGMVRAILMASLNDGTEFEPARMTERVVRVFLQGARG